MAVYHTRLPEQGVPPRRAARELGLKPRELELAVQLAEVRTVASGPGERVRLDALRPVPATARPESAAAAEVIGTLVTARDPDETEWHRHCLAVALLEARADRPALPARPRVTRGRGEEGGDRGRAPTAGAEGRPRPARPRRLWARLWRPRHAARASR
ncbi:DUF6397 family protein [Streptomyces sp. NPDC049577]|uniref:DUF6397 family protein n=1 Tax=Streptomyces sp. NPDC049577 TaxID=3155153 RepID=UPI003419997A